MERHQRHVIKTHAIWHGSPLILKLQSLLNLSGKGFFVMLWWRNVVFWEIFSSLLWSRRPPEAVFTVRKWLWWNGRDQEIQDFTPKFFPIHKQSAVGKVWERLTNQINVCFRPQCCSAILVFINLSSFQLLVSCGGGRRPVDGLCQQYVHTIRPLVWDTLEDLPPLGLHTWDKDSTLHARTWTNQYSMTNELNHGTSLNSRDDTVLMWTWVFMTSHMEEAMDKR